jgi:phage baseplate assembly protein gpV
MNEVFVVVYYNVDEVNNSEVIGVYDTKEDAVNALITAAHYEDDDGALLQYKRRSHDYESFQELERLVWDTMTLVDDDIYRIETIYNQ